MIRGGENLADKSAGTTINKFSSIFLHQRKSRKNHALSDKQQYSLVLFFKMKRKKNRHLIKLSKEIWQYLLNHNLSIIAEYLPPAPNTVEDKQLRKKRLFRVASPSQSFSNVFSTTYLFASCLCHQLPQRIVQYPDPYNQRTKTTKQNWYLVVHIHSSFQHDFKSTPKTKTGKYFSSDSNCTGLDQQTMLPRTFKPLC